MRKWFSGAVIGAMVAAVAACGGDGTGPGNGQPPPAPPPPPPPPPATVPGADVTINMEGIAFIDPDGNRNQNATVTISVGQTVGWANNDAEAHTVTSGEGMNGQDGDGLPAGATAIASGTLDPGDDFTQTFDVAGTYTYFCEFHPTDMFDATIIVEE